MIESIAPLIRFPFHYKLRLYSFFNTETVVRNGMVLTAKQVTLG